MTQKETDKLDTVDYPRGPKEARAELMAASKAYEDALLTVRDRLAIQDVGLSGLTPAQRKLLMDCVDVVLGLEGVELPVSPGSASEQQT